MVSFLDHTTAHEVYHLKLAFAKKAAYFVPQNALKYYQRGGYTAFSVEDFFPQLYRRMRDKAHVVVHDLSERIRDFYINRELAKMPGYDVVTRNWELEQMAKDIELIRNQIRRFPAKQPDYEAAMILLDVSMRNALLHESGTLVDLSLISDRKTIEKVSGLLEHSNPIEPYSMQTTVEEIVRSLEFDEIISK